jgi:hypothetical protein
MSFTHNWPLSKKIKPEITNHLPQKNNLTIQKTIIKRHKNHQQKDHHQPKNQLKRLKQERP